MQQLIGLANPYRAALTHLEEDYLQAYDANVPGSVALLNQDPRKGRGQQSNAQGVLHSVIRNPGIHFSLSHGRWLSGSEMLMTQGVPVRSEDCPGRIRCSSFCPGGIVEDAERSRQDKVAWAGNGLNVPSAGVVKLLALLYCKRADQTEAARVYAHVGRGSADADY